MQLASFDIFDTCLLRKCGTPTNFYDVLSYKVFAQDVSNDVRKDFAVARRKAEDKVWGEKPQLQLKDIYADLKFNNPFLLPKEEMVRIEIELERLMLTHSLKAKALVDKERNRGSKIVFISDMYLPQDFIKDILAEYGFFKEGDRIYISNEFGLTKQSGTLYEKVQELENVSFHDWRHYGDNLESDVRIPRSLGIKAKQLVNEYTPYPLSWKESCVTLFNYPSILAGVSRAVYHSQENDSHKAFVLDLIAPFYSSFVYRILEDAQNRGITSLYFCARDAYQVYGVAQRFSFLFPEIKLEYLYISRESLYHGNDEAKIQYFKRIGLATQEGTVGIVDITTSGKTLLELNKYLVTKGYNKVYGYYFLLWDDPREIPVEKEWCHFELEVARLRRERAFYLLTAHIMVFENYFALNGQGRTIDYKKIDGEIKPVFDYSSTEIETLHENVEYWSKRHCDLLAHYADMFICCGLHNYSKEILHDISLPYLLSFFDIPDVAYLPALEQYKVFSRRCNSHVPYVCKRNIIQLVSKRGLDTEWPRGSVIMSVPFFLRNAVIQYYRGKTSNR